MQSIEKLIRDYTFDLSFKQVFDYYGADALAAELTRLAASTTDPEFYNFTITFARDIAIGSDLTNSDLERYDRYLRLAGFFDAMAAKLDYPNLSVRAATVYNFGKFSKRENAPYLEDAYESVYRNQDPVLSSRCLSEMLWLRSAKFDDYWNELSQSLDLLDKITGALFYSVHMDLAPPADFFRGEWIDLIGRPQKNLSPREHAEQWVESFEMCVFDMHHKLELPAWTRAEFDPFIRFCASQDRRLEFRGDREHYRRMYQQCFGKDRSDETA
ncbi:MAG: hypothetical protein NXI24_02735 [bacterium]|nr:hypothetical protein [bacterium]